MLELATDPAWPGVVLASLPGPRAGGRTSPFGLTVTEWVRGELVLGRTWSVADTYLRGHGDGAVRFYKMEAVP